MSAQEPGVAFSWRLVSESTILIRRVTLWLLLLSLSEFLASAQHSNGYVFAGPGSASDCSCSTIQAGAGFEFVFLKRIGAGLEASAMGLTGSVLGSFGVLSPNGYLHLGRGGKFDPFVTAGYSRLQSIDGGANAFNCGAFLGRALRPCILVPYNFSG